MKGTKQYVNKFLQHILLIILSIVFVYPVLWMILVSFKNEAEFYTDPWGLPTKLRWENYVVAFRKINLFECYANTLYVALISIIAIIVCSFLCAYALQRIRFKTSKNHFYKYGQYNGCSVTSPASSFIYAFEGDGLN